VEPVEPKAHILLVDDQPANLLALQEILAGLDQPLVQARSGEEALRRLLEDDFAVVLLDVQMKGLDGFETARLIRGRERSRHTPIIFLTAYETTDFPAEKAYSLGAVDYLVKPLVPTILRAKVRFFVQLSQQAEQVRRLERRQLADETLRASERRFRAIIENSWDAIALLAADATIRYASPSTARVLGYPPQEFAGRNAFAFMHPDDLQRTTEIFARLVQHSGTTLTATFQFRHQDNSWRWIEATCTGLLEEPGVHAVVVNYRDVTNQRRAEEAIATLNRELQDRLAELDEAARRKDDFLAALAHELRNPLSPVLMGLHLLGESEVDAAEARRLRAMVERQVRHLSRLVDDLLDVSRITRNKIALRQERLDLARLVRTAAEDRRPTLEQAGLALTLEGSDVPVWVQGDATRLVQVLNNLLDNAVKFTERGKRVTVRVAADEVAHQAVLLVRDEGVGIEEKMLPHLFDAFVQADRSLDRSRGGLGLGLALVKGLVELHGGKAEATSAGPGRGADFTVRLPLQAEAPVLSQRPAASQTAGERLRVLGVEDNRDAAESLQVVLERFGHEVRVAYDGPEGVRMALAWRPDVILCDIGLPGLDGYGVARQLRCHPATARTRLLAVTGYGREEDRRRASEAGFNDLLVKPVDPNGLQHILMAPREATADAQLIT
jgi:PAS domain S-box-containing protein